jgi:hypothetical protein
MDIKKWTSLLLVLFLLGSCTSKRVYLTDGIDDSAGGVQAYVITTPSSVYYLEKKGGGLSSMIDKDSIDWIGFHNKKGSAHKGEYRGFPNAIHRQDGSYFHAMNTKTDPSTSEVTIKTEQHVRIIFTSENQQWQGQWDFYPNRCDFTMRKVSPDYKYWVQYEGVPGGEMNTTDFWYASVDNKQHLIKESFTGDLPSPEWMAFGDQNSPRVIYMLHQEDDDLPDNYVSRSDMTVFGFGRENKETTSKHLTTVQTFSIGFIESTKYATIKKRIRKVLEVK